MKILICVLCIATIVDMLCYRIPNLWIGIGMVAGLVIAVREGGIVMLSGMLLQIMMIFLVFYPFYLIKGLGAGDVKLFLLLGCYLSGECYLRCLLIAMVLAGIWAIGKIICFSENRKRLYNLLQYGKKAVFTGVFEEYTCEKGSKRSVIRLSVPVLCSVLLCYGGGYYI